MLTALNEVSARADVVKLGYHLSGRRCRDGEEMQLIGLDIPFFDINFDRNHSHYPHALRCVMTQTNLGTCSVA